LKNEYQQYGEPPEQTSVQQRTPWRRRKAKANTPHRSSRGREGASDERECHPLGRPLARPPALTLSRYIMRRLCIAWDPGCGAALGLKAVETPGICPRRSCRTCPVLFPIHRGASCKYGGA